ncbi:MAG TPA: hydroxymethylglutaryl-CoA lyase [Planctomycetota bacterium]|nr:hydroxymethylglutaryl-CoA lyase [Planctomycetota bacterium]
MPSTVTLVETPRDAFQGLKRFIPTPEKIRHIAALLDAGFTHVDLGSFVSLKAVPQMADSEQVFAAFAARPNLERIAIVANKLGAQRAFAQAGVDTLGFPFSLSERFQLDNTGKTLEQTWPAMRQIHREAMQHGKAFILYLSMAFGTLRNARAGRTHGGEAWSEEGLLAFVEMLVTISGIRHISLADTVGVATPTQVERVFKLVRSEFPSVEFSAHFHGTARNWMNCIDAALEAGCRRFDCAAGGLGGCPFACNELIANTPSEKLVARLEERGFATGIDLEKIKLCAKTARAFQKQYA